MSAFPKNFIFSTATSSYQVEGAWNEDGKGENIWDHQVHTRPNSIMNQNNADITCDFYHKYKEDIALVKEANFDMYRFSISWARILPNGDTSVINQKGIQYYHNLIDELLKNGIQPMVTMFHWDLPQKLQDIGGWVNPIMADYMQDYADLLLELYGDKVKWWITLNEPHAIALGYESIGLAPSANLSIPPYYVVIHNILRAHGKIFRLYDRKYRSKQKGKISCSLANIYYKGKTDSKEDTDAANRAMLFTMGLAADPIFGKDGNYPKFVRDYIDDQSKKEGRKRSRLPEFTEEERKSIQGSFDFFALNHYTTNLCTPGSPPNATYSIKDMNMTVSYDPEWGQSGTFWLKTVPFGVRELLKYIKNRYGNVPVFICENGYCDNGGLEDKERLYYHKEYLKEILNAMNNYQCNVIGYTAWAFLDNFEWCFGYTNKFGLVHVDFDDEKRKRTPKSSYYFFKQLLKNRTIPE